MAAQKMHKPLPDERMELAALMVAEGRHTLESIGSACGVDPRTVTNWKDDDDFEKRVEATVRRMASRVQKYGIARLERRVSVLQDMHDKLLQVVNERAASPEMSDVPGGRTGLMVRQLKGVGKGDDFQIVEEYTIDAALIRELRGIHERVAKEVGHEVVQVDLSVTAKAPDQMTDAELEQALTLLCIDFSPTVEENKDDQVAES